MNIERLAAELALAEEQVSGKAETMLLRPGERVSIAGVAGPEGPQGPAGETVVGPRGVDGEQGPQGIPGEIGPIGPQGIPGNDGRDGIDGKPGAKGPKGDPGRDGESITGPKGERGPSGPRGPAGTRGGGGGGGGGGSLAVLDEAVSLTTSASSMNFAGAGVTATAVGTAVTVTVPGATTGDLDAVLTAGNDGGGIGIVNVPTVAGLPGTGAATGASILLPNASGTDGGELEAFGGNNDAGGTGASFELGPSNGDGEGGYGLLRGGDAVSGQVAGKATLQGGNNGGASGAFWEATGGNDTDEGFVLGGGRALGFNVIGGSPVGIELTAAVGEAAAAGSRALISAGSGDSGNDFPALIQLNPGDGVGNHGRIQVQTDGVSGSAGQVLTAQGDDTALWAPFLAGSAQTYTESNVTTDRTFNANATSIDELADVLGTLIVDLRARGVVA